MSPRMTSKLPPINEAMDDHITIEEITLEEISNSLQRVKPKSAPGEDGLSYKIIARLPEQMMSLICEIYNICLKSGYYPRSWKSAIGIMLPKPNKDHKIATNNRPISLLKCVGKLFEKIIGNRLTKFLTSENKLNKWQRAYLKGKEAGEHVHRLGSTARKVIQSNSTRNWYTGAILLDVEKAFDSV